LLWEVHYGWPERLDDIIGDNVENVPDPNGVKDMDKDSEEWDRQFDHWMPLADFYQYDHIQYFDSWQDMYDKYDSMSSEDLLEISSKMRGVNTVEYDDLVNQWRTIFSRVNGGA